MSKPAVSIIVARKIGADDLSAVLSSVQAQSYSDYEIVIAEPQDSISIARNQAAKRAGGEYLAFVDSDQLWSKNKLEKQLLKLHAGGGLRWCYCAAWTPGPDSAPYHSGDILRPLLLKNFIPSGSVVIDRTVFNDLGGFSESELYRLSEEWDLWIRVAAVYPLGLVDEQLVQLSQEASTSAQKQLSMKRVVESAVATHGDRLKDLRSESLAEICISAGNDRLKANQRNEARQSFEEALTHSPLRPDAYLNWISSFLSSEAQQQIRDLHNLGRQLQKMETSKTTEKMGLGG